MRTARWLALVILAGNQRYEAARHLKLREVPTHLIEGLTAEKEREIIIRDNVENGEFDFGILASEWASEPLVDWGVSVPEPKDDGESLRPGIVLIHGGGWISGTRYQQLWYYQNFAKHGFVVMTIDYRLMPEHPRQAGIEIGRAHV